MADCYLVKVQTRYGQLDFITSLLIQADNKLAALREALRISSQGNEQHVAVYENDALADLSYSFAVDCPNHDFRIAIWGEEKIEPEHLNALMSYHKLHIASNAPFLKGI